jgi:hypothetical protein
MKNKLYRQPKIVIFSKWSGKNYAIFNSLDKIVNIARLSIDMCLSSLRKNSNVINLLEYFTHIETEENYDTIADIDLLDTLSFNTIGIHSSLNRDEYCRNCITIY